MSAYDPTWGHTIEEAEVAPGTLGLLYDETPRLTTADVKPFVWAILLFRNAIRRHEVVGAITPICAHAELYGGWSEYLDDEDNRTRLEWLVDEVLGEMTAQGILRYSSKADLWILEAGQNKRHLPEIIKAVAGVGGSMPQHLVMELNS
jgi:hypothetical protein